MRRSSILPVALFLPGLALIGAGQPRGALSWSSLGEEQAFALGAGCALVGFAVAFGFPRLRRAIARHAVRALLLAYAAPVLAALALGGASGFPLWVALFMGGEAGVFASLALAWVVDPAWRAEARNALRSGAGVWWSVRGDGTDPAADRRAARARRRARD